MSIQEWLNETLAILVLYKKPLKASTSFTSLTRSLRTNNASLDLFIYDNSPDSGENFPHNLNWKIIYQHDPSNPGISKAYNEGAKKAYQLGKKWLLLLDQDTDFQQDALANYYKAILDDSNQVCFVPRLIDSVGIISPFKFQLGNGLRIKSVSEGVYSFKELQFVNSGLMISVKAFQSVNGYDETFPLDFSDYAFVERLRKNNSSFVMTSVTGNHDFSGSQNSSPEDQLKRFTFFISAAKQFRKSYHPNNWFITIRTWLRAIKLTVRFKSLKFLVRLVTQKND
jgi:rhamnosyltransferase